MIRIGLNGGGLVTIDGDRLDLSAVTPEKLAFGLSHVTRFGGQGGPLSVGEHTVRLFEWARQNGEPKVLLRAILLHDAPETLGEGDHQRFVKRAFFGDGPAKFSDLICTALWARFRPKRPTRTWAAVHAKLKPYDEWIGTVEARVLGFPHEELPPGLLVPGIAIPQVPVEYQAEWWQQEYLRCWRESE